MHVAIVTLPYNAAGRGRGGGAGPQALLELGLERQLNLQGHAVTSITEVTMSTADAASYGGWQRVGRANGRLADTVEQAAAVPDTFVLGLLADCNGVLGMLGGLTRTGRPQWPRRVGLVWVDAHGDYNTPETSPSGMLGGMPVAVAAGRCLTNLRRQSGLRVALSPADIVYAGLRDLDPPEQAAIEADEIVCLTTGDLINASERLHWTMRHLSEREDLIYVHVDLDILDPVLAPAAGLPCPGGISGAALGRALATLLAYPKVRALAVVSYDPERDLDGRTGAEVMAALSRGFAPGGSDED